MVMADGKLDCLVIFGWVDVLRSAKENGGLIQALGIIMDGTGPLVFWKAPNKVIASARLPSQIRYLRYPYLPHLVYLCLNNNIIPYPPFILHQPRSDGHHLLRFAQS